MLVTLKGYRVNETNNANTKNLLNNIINQRKMFLLVTGVRQKKKVGGRTLDLPESGTILIHFLLENCITNYTAKRIYMLITSKQLPDTRSCSTRPLDSQNTGTRLHVCTLSSG